MDYNFMARPLRSDEAVHYRELRLQALHLHPGSFGSSFEEEALLKIDAFADRLADGRVFGIWLGAKLVACAGLAVREKAKLRHKGHLWGMFVRPEVRGRGIGNHLLQEVLAHSRTCCEEVLLTVIADNTAAYQLYATAGFTEYGREPRAIKIGPMYFDELLMRLPLEGLT
ncbi:GNAT family N-acetyltransferase [Erythrobacter sp. A6_0]|uniref:GNAT family N-acetyltransferase n=1 Tax=Erythrobacter sp. A6_0 TaxID=2821089 RepID=UPI001ADB8697|nr:GNAT family N-acetyltransferase [Erythrobacter sp. A6_0]MBO9510748.1 GNAT family N-acetyltransferase [Erythrobacter sp. A6_0]